MTVEHPSERLVSRYARGEVDIPADEVWAVESHLESCAVCRARLADVVEGSTAALVQAVWTDLEPQLTPKARPRWNPLRGLAGWTTPAMVPWLVMTTAVTLVALLFDRFARSPDNEVSVVLLLAPVLPVLGVAVSWAKALDPMHEIVASTPRAGLYLLLRRTVSVLLVVIPTLLFAGSGTSTALWLLPCLAFTTGTLALGGLVGVTRAAAGLIAVWAAVIIAPSVAMAQPSFALHHNGLPVWGALFVLGALVVAVRRGAYADLGAHR
ncbi:zf-HC2 domain-containing protein [Umezawaea endophytica]|uniref:Zf-HC2 domain-containing protein n=1 Tax=Umezawaea endophytica TaxID=1654476 RepID=A0A9X2VIT7_9PSEU|nr:zf-HC2 domain-containing protein [Umezawaea endophytica]MCS7477430.1 zf-HC2 domain-containing protein [Umezawaea endophytica]